MYSLISYPKLSALKCPHLRYVKRILGSFDWLTLSPASPPSYTSKIRSCCTSATYHTSTYEEERPWSMWVRHSATTAPQKPCSTLQEQTNSCRGTHESCSSPIDEQELGERQKKERGPWQEKEGRKEGERSNVKKGKSTHRSHVSPTVPLQQPWLQQCLFLLPWAPVHPAIRPSLEESTG